MFATLFGYGTGEPALPLLQRTKDNSAFLSRGHINDPSSKKTINYTTALENFQKVLIDLINNKSSITHQFDYDIATLHYKIGEIYFQMKNYEQALDQFEKAVDIYLNAFPLTLSNLLRNYDAITDTSILTLKNYLDEHEYHFRFIPLRYSLLAEIYHYMASIYFLEPKHIETAVSIYKLATAIKSIRQDYEYDLSKKQNLVVK